MVAIKSTVLVMALMAGNVLASRPVFSRHEDVTVVSLDDKPSSSDSTAAFSGYDSSRDKSEGHKSEGGYSDDNGKKHGGGSKKNGGRKSGGKKHHGKSADGDCSEGTTTTVAAAGESTSVEFTIESIVHDSTTAAGAESTPAPVGESTTVEAGRESTTAAAEPTEDCLDDDSTTTAAGAIETTAVESPASMPTDTALPIVFGEPTPTPAASTEVISAATSQWVSVAGVSVFAVMAGSMLLL
ncbi:uncharacterized protein EV422DRAFT_565978 [Fimicolochytrium jonesii]|uniref:uncharacterized protein n=1 Tax=Fimicolochytrium jonesii TaxID=1396493 RepID=UPI0022FDEF16|nr:uncharacterized protein EV422DRAFT_565978 [Fimicolochytrium jonesii]KAI8823113.1 hypothetical protein EV422DRAFT_565978 [Fimicolochytrium jonesii]